MDNSQIARIFQEIAELLDLKGENVFKVRAYEKAARVIESHPRAFSDYQELSELTKIPGIGKSIAEKIFEIVKNFPGIEFDKICSSSKIFPEKVASILALLEIKGYLKEIKGRYYPLV